MGRCKTEAECTHVPWCRLNRECHRATQKAPALPALIEPDRELMSFHRPGNPNELDPPQLLASKLIDAWCTAHQGQITWKKAVQITAIICKMPADEEKRLLSLGDDS